MEVSKQPQAEHKSHFDLSSANYPIVVEQSLNWAPFEDVDFPFVNNFAVEKVLNSSLVEYYNHWQENSCAACHQIAY